MFTEWFNENENRAYPIREEATGIATSGESLPYGFLADLGIVVPRVAADSAYLSMLAVTDNLVSISIAYSGGGLLVGTFANAGLINNPQALSPVTPNAAGFVVFGRALDTTRGTFVFTDAAASGLEYRVVRPFDPLPISSIGKINGSTSQRLTGVIRLVAGTNVNIFEDGGNIVVELAEAVRSDFVGPCDRQAAFTTCGKPPLRQLNGVGPDGTGKLIIEVE